MTHLSLAPFWIRRRTGAIVAAFLVAPLFLNTPARSQSATPRDLIKAGVDAYILGGPGSAFSAWTKGSVMEGSTQLRIQFDGLKQIEATYGRLEGFDVILDLNVSTRVRFIYFVLNYARGPAYGYLEVYRLKSGGWVPTDMSINTKPSEVIPATLLPRISTAP
jgi:hypothetical protein